METWQNFMLGMGVREGFIALKSHLLLTLVPNVSHHLLFLESCSQMSLPRESLLGIQLNSRIK